ncbi:Uncharacterized protein dnm_056410 [Desulfonema magnum]|uniref:Uncharacterized protein n=1 Tax=Desulfonema magnum TaxID=45655 RepID=A0A975BQA4_9BACT|nr:Uncharacterized protein dnm_056410 [Desulfonema magnum]
MFLIISQSKKQNQGGKKSIQKEKIPTFRQTVSEYDHRLKSE